VPEARRPPRGRWASLAASVRRKRLDRRELTWLLVGLGACVLLLGFLALAGEVIEGDTQGVDVRILQALRSRTDLSRPIGPPWIENALFDLSALGGTTILGLVVAAVAGFLVLQQRYRTALVIVATTVSGEVLNVALKQLFNRPRPSAVPHLRDVSTASFPSGHAMESAIVYLTLGAILMRVAERRVTKLYCLTVACLLTFLTGVSRVYLGVHYPTDVLGGWIVGFVWASACWLAARRFEAAAHIEAEKTKASGADGTTVA
jgi:undecaprenyl-diphosphatase